MNHDYRTWLDVLRITRILVLTYLLLGGGTDIKLLVIVIIHTSQ